MSQGVRGRVTPELGWGAWGDLEREQGLGPGQAEKSLQTVSQKASHLSWFPMSSYFL